MKKLPTQVIEVDNEGLISLLGKKVTLFCMNYIYTGLSESFEFCEKCDERKS